MGKNTGMTEIIKAVLLLIESAIIVFWINVLLYGHITPGGKFLLNFIGGRGPGVFNLVSGGIIPLENIVIGVKVGTLIFLVFGTTGLPK